MAFISVTSMKYLAALLLALSLPAGAESNTSLDFKIVIPPVVALLENQVTGNSQQRLVVLSNVKSGFCVNLSIAGSGRIGWEIQQVSELESINLSLVDNGYQLCSKRSGIHEILLIHSFPNGVEGWPVNTVLTKN